VTKIEFDGAIAPDQLNALSAGDLVEITGDVITVRDATALTLVRVLEAKKPLPFDLNGQLLYAVGPSPAKPGQVVGSAGPTTTERLSPYLDCLFRAGARGIVGKGELHGAVEGTFHDHRAVYFAAVGGIGALLGKQVVSAELVAFPDLGPEAVYRFRIKDFPAVVIIDVAGRNYHDLARRPWRKRSS